MLTPSKLHCEPVPWASPNKMKIFSATFGHLQQWPTVCTPLLPWLRFTMSLMMPLPNYEGFTWSLLSFACWSAYLSVHDGSSPRQCAEYDSHSASGRSVGMAMAMDWMIPICRASFCGLNAQTSATLGWSSVDTCDCYTLGDTANIASLGLEHFYAAFGLKGSREPATCCFSSLATRSGVHHWRLLCKRKDGCRPTISVVTTWYSSGSASQQTSQERCSGSPTQCDIDKHSSDHPGLSGSDASSSSETGSTVDDMEELRESYSSLQALTAEMREVTTSSDQRDPHIPSERRVGVLGRPRLTRFLPFPPTWPLARMLLPIKFVVKQAETLLQNYCFETIAACKSPEQQNQYVFRMGRDLGQLMAMRLAEIVTELMQSVLQHRAKALVDESNAPLLTQRFWVQARYTELLHASSRFRARRTRKRNGHLTGLSKSFVCPSKGRFKSDMAGGLTR